MTVFQKTLQQRRDIGFIVNNKDLHAGDVGTRSSCGGTLSTADGCRRPRSDLDSSLNCDQRHGKP